MKVFSLVYAERANDSSVSSSLCGPYLFLSRDAAIDNLLEYVRGRVVDLGLDFFFERMREHGLDTGELDDEDGVTEALFDQFVGGLDHAGKCEVATWYFDFASDECVDASYSIDEHETGVLDDFAEHLGSKVDEALEEGGDVGQLLSDDNLAALANAFDPVNSYIARV